MFKELSVSQKMMKMHKEMKGCKIKWYFFRNNFRSTNYYYNKFIEIIGLEAWKKLDPYYKSEWNSARYSFDRMYGLIRAWRVKDSFPPKSETKNIEEDFRQMLPALSEKMEEITKHLADRETLKLEKTVKEISEHIEILEQHLRRNGGDAKTNLEKGLEALEKKLAELLNFSENGQKNNE